MNWISRTALTLVILEAALAQAPTAARAQEVPSLAPEVAPAPPTVDDPGAGDEFPETAPLSSGETPPPEGQTLAPEPAPEAAPLSEPVVAEREDAPETAPSSASESESVADFDPRIPRYTLARPSLAISFAAAIRALNAGAPSAELAPTDQARGISLQFEYQPKFLQFMGVFGFGPSLNFYPLTKEGSLTPSPSARPVLAVWSVGGQVRYQLRLFREQPLVPMVGYSVESIAYSLNSGTSGRFLAQGPFFGAMLLLNFFEPDAAGEFYVSQGINRSYLTAELRQIAGSDDSFTVTGQSLFFGLRFEF